MKQQTFTVLVLIFFLLFLPFSAAAELLDQGGYDERFKGRGDNVPPECQLDVPLAASSPFFVKWNCTDDDAESHEIRTELWMYRNGVVHSELAASFLGFPAAKNIDLNVLDVENFTDGLPVSFRLLARDRAGSSTVSELHTVSSQAIAIKTCDLSVVTEATETSEDGSTTGTPSLTSSLDDAPANTTQLDADNIRIVSSENAKGSPCEVDAVCSNDEYIMYDAFLTLAEDNSVSGTLIVSPGISSMDVSGSASLSDGVLLTDVSVSGTTTLSGVDTSVTLVCSD